MFCVKSASSCEETIKKSRFIGVLTSCADEQEVNRILQRLHTEHPAASHIAYAYRITTGNGLISRFHDAGEPSGTAGKPIFQHLEGNNLINVLLAVIRYFGGVKLGAGGLTRAYGGSARQVIETAELFPYIEYAEQRFQLDYKQMQSFEHFLKKLNGEIIEQRFSGQVDLVIKLPKHHLQEFREMFKA